MEIKAYFESHKIIIEEQLKLAKEEVCIAVAWINFKEYYNAFEGVLNNSVQLSIICTDNPQNRSYHFNNGYKHYHLTEHFDTTLLNR